MRKTSKFISLFALLLTLSLTFSSCGVFFFSYDADISDRPSADGLEDIKTPESSDKVSPEILDFGITNTFDPKGALSKLYRYDYGFSYITVAVTNTNNSMFADTGLFLDSCIYDRNTAIESGLSLKFSTAKGSASNIVKETTSAQDSLTHYADLIAVPLSAVSLFKNKNILCDPSTLPFLSEADEWLIDGSALSLEDERFVISEASFMPSKTKVIFFNTEMIESSGKDSPYTLISSNKWTWDALADYLGESGSLACAEDIEAIIRATVNVDTEEGADSDTSDTENTESTENTENTEEKGDSEAETGDPTEEKIKELVALITANAVKKETKEKFLAGETLFYLGSFADISDFTSTDTVFGLLPVPVFNEGDNYSDIFSADDVTVFACPKSASDIERSAFLITAIAAASSGSRANAFYKILEESMLRDNGSRLSIGYIFRSDIKIIY